MFKIISHKYTGVVLVLMIISACAPKVTTITPTQKLPENFNGTDNNENSATINWKEFFNDQYLIALIDTALSNNQELNIILQEISMTNNEIMASKGEYLPNVNVGGALRTEKVGRYTSQGANDANTDIAPGKEFPEPLSDFLLTANVSWEIDIWKKLRNSKKVAVIKYLSSIEGKNFMITNLVSEIAHLYYELLALDNQLTIVKNTIEIQQNALKIVEMEKQSAKVTELAVKKFEAEVFKNQSHQYDILQEIIEIENEINLLVGRFPQKIDRNSEGFNDFAIQKVSYGVPSQLLSNRPDIKQAELNLEAAKLNIQITKADFYPSLRIDAGVGIQAFNPTYLLKAPESLLYSIAGDLIAPIINRKAIKANYFNANAKQIQAVYEYQQSVLKAHIEVYNQLTKVENLSLSFENKQKQVDALTRSISISNSLFRSARADYMEVLMTQRDALEAKIELIEIKKHQMNTIVKMYQSLGGGWQ